MSAWRFQHGFIRPDGAVILAADLGRVKGEPRKGFYDKRREPSDKERETLNMHGDGWTLFERVVPA